MYKIILIHIMVMLIMMKEINQEDRHFEGCMIFQSTVYRFFLNVILMSSLN